MQPLLTRIEQDTQFGSKARKVLGDGTISNVEAARLINQIGISTSEAGVRRARSLIDFTPAPTTSDDEFSGSESGNHAEVDPEGITVYVDKWPVELDGDFGPLIEFFGFNPEHFEVVDDSVRVGKWQQSKGTDDGGRDVIWLYSYKVRFHRISEPLDDLPDLDEIRRRAEKFTVRRSAPIRLSTPVLYVHQQGDEQIGKKEGGGLEGVVGRIEDAIQKSVDRLAAMQKRGANIVGIVDVANGDTIENIFGHYPSQQRTTATLRNQFRIGLDLDIARTKAFAEFGLPLDKIYTTDNHGEIRQKIGLAPFTSESDNLALILAETVKTALNDVPGFRFIDWHIPHDEWWTLATIAGVNFAVGHGHKAIGKLDQWAQNQRDYLHMHQDFKAHLMLLGHRHHFLLQDISGTTMIQTPSLDGGSPFFAMMKGHVSRSGVVTYLASTEFNQFFSDLEVL